MLAIIAAIENDFEREFITQIYLTYYKKMRAKSHLSRVKCVYLQFIYKIKRKRKAIQVF